MKKAGEIITDNIANKLNKNVRDRTATVQKQDTKIQRLICKLLLFREIKLRNDILVYE